MAQAQIAQELNGMGLPVDIKLKQDLPIYYLLSGNLRSAGYQIPKGVTITVDSLKRMGNEQDVFDAAAFGFGGKTCWARISDLKLTH